METFTNYYVYTGRGYLQITNKQKIEDIEYFLEPKCLYPPSRYTVIYKGNKKITTYHHIGNLNNIEIYTSRVTNIKEISYP